MKRCFYLYLSERLVKSAILVAVHPRKKKEKKEEMGVLTQDLNLNKSTEIHEEKIFTGRNTNLETE